MIEIWTTNLQCVFFFSSFRSSHYHLLYEIGVLKKHQETPTIFAKTPVLESLFWWSCTLKARYRWLWHGCFPLNFAKFLRTFFLIFIYHLRWLLPMLRFKIIGLSSFEVHFGIYDGITYTFFFYKQLNFFGQVLVA